ncbi:leucine-rich repeat-containing protein 2 isoform X2 [Muntiacus reevesi]|uniref:leucine-rich repeat-containing protein 2 isoform X2 n=1 Tax=Muntiacus reevesi TaxID=9886 RepID=UPI003306D164
MGHKVVVFDISVVRALWETRVKKHKAWQKKEAERLEKSALEKIKEEWNFVAECRRKGIPQAEYCKNGFVDTSVRLLERIERRSLAAQSALSKERDKRSSEFVFELSGDHWKEFPDSLKEQTHLKEWHISNTLIQIIPKYIELFQAMRILDLPKNQIARLPAEIGCLKNLKELNVSFNRLKSIPPELGDCENLEKLDCSGNLELTELPFENLFPAIPLKYLSAFSFDAIHQKTTESSDLWRIYRILTCGAINLPVVGCHRGIMAWA